MSMCFNLLCDESGDAIVIAAVLSTFTFIYGCKLYLFGTINNTSFNQDLNQDNSLTHSQVK